VSKLVDPVNRQTCDSPARNAKRVAAISDAFPRGADSFTVRQQVVACIRDSRIERTQVVSPDCQLAYPLTGNRVDVPNGVENDRSSAGDARHCDPDATAPTRVYVNVELLERNTSDSDFDPSRNGVFRDVDRYTVTCSQVQGTIRRGEPHSQRLRPFVSHKIGRMRNLYGAADPYDDQDE
jgi:hypothetical protein